MISLILVMVCAIAAGWLARRIDVPYPIVLVLAGIGLGVAYAWPALDLSPEVVLAIVIPSILYPAAIDTSWRDFRLMLRPILLLATGLVALTTLAVGAALKWLVPDAPWSVAFALGAIVSPPDAVAATAVLRRFRLPRRIMTLLEGESLVNDATGLVLYRFAVVAALTGTFSGPALVAQFAMIAVGGLAVGIGVGVVSTRLQRHLRDPMLELAMSLTAPFLAYWICETLSVSGVLGVVAAGLYRSRWSHRRASALARLNIRTVWGAVVFVINSFVFVLIGIQMPHIAASLVDADGLTRPHVALLVAALSAVAIGVRFLWIFAATYGVRLLVPSIRRTDPASARVSTLVSWSGMRGVVSLAAALALPTALESGAAFPDRNLLILLAYGIVFVTLVGQGLTLPVLIRWLGIKPDSSGDDETRLARDAMRRAATSAVDRLVAEHGFPVHDAVAVKRFFNSRSGREEGALDADRETRLWLGASSAQREALIELWKNGEIGDDVLIALERELDLAEARLPQND
ncbi:MAG TPA: Na+/H+ antiporter [Gammaproteobacteria bacterium]|nr:Na+/H+ antiporter [Gammaproteobacteria bacterium]